MFESDILEVAVGIVFVFVLISTIGSAMREALEAWLKTRASYLEFGIRELLFDQDGTGLAQRFYNHPLIFPLYEGEYIARKGAKRPWMWRSGDNLPSYIPASNFAVALLDIVARGPTGVEGPMRVAAPPLSLAAIRANASSLGNPPVQHAVMTALDLADVVLQRARAYVE